ncbi:MAG: phosphatase PAP2 family protein [Gemmatimonadaceae bacterium]
MEPSQHNGHRVAPVWLRYVAKQWVYMVALATVALALLGKVGEDVFEHESTAFDNAVHMWIVAHQNPILFDIFLFITWIGSSVPVIVGTLALAVWLWRRRVRYVAAVVMTAAVGATGIFLVIKQFFHRIRPPGAIRLHVLTYAFPSGHATTSAAVFVTVAYVLARERILSRRNAVVLGVTGPLLIGASRIYLDVHWATDVLGGWAAGLLIAALSAALYERLRVSRTLTGKPLVQ